MKPRTIAAAALAWTMAVTGAAGQDAAVEQPQQAQQTMSELLAEIEAREQEIARLNGEVRALEAELEFERLRQWMCLDGLRLRIVSVPYDEHGVMIEQARLIPRRPDCFGWRSLTVENLVVRDGKLILGGRPLVVR